jgi:hypothetical protein
MRGHSSSHISAASDARSISSSSIQTERAEDDGQDSWAVYNRNTTGARNPNQEASPSSKMHHTFSEDAGAQSRATVRQNFSGASSSTEERHLPQAKIHVSPAIRDPNVNVVAAVSGDGQYHAQPAEDRLFWAAPGQTSTRTISSGVAAQPQRDFAQGGSPAMYSQIVSWDSHQWNSSPSQHGQAQRMRLEGNAGLPFMQARPTDSGSQRSSFNSTCANSPHQASRVYTEETVGPLRYARADDNSSVSLASLVARRDSSTPYMELVDQTWLSLHVKLACKRKN